MIYRSKAPLRIGFAGGGTDVSPYSDEFGGAILNATINLYAYASIELLDEPVVILETTDRGEHISYPWSESLPIDGFLDLHKGVHNKLISLGHLKKQGYKLTTFVEAPAGSGLGTSSTLMIAILGAYQEWLSLPFGEYDTAHLAYDIERVDLAMAGG
ncbi:MAG: GHMP kinase, partial [Salibacteraceae bacterium]|nr:GHMP kinase [Salibacteraceae bacterium]MDP4934424.1 GHMP kinase [Salibacteraceae bacterium]